MKKKNFTKAFTIAMVSASLLAVGPASAVLAKNVGGGDWNYGYSWNYGWSKYYHGTRKHSATVAYNSDEHRDTRARGYTAYAEYHKIPPTGLSYWWNVY
ncbi:MAG: lactococcin 972 family bacteriocin [Lactobacillus crispatus]|uniref:lactococcin 972 family bacteriocin n=1 Tax=Bacilli TaxID=91061 RepID=UPI000E5260C5|nr:MULTISPECIES: lactococcin 972 family bacteriocin [Lactobacillus]NLS86393.1 lactococcin 972 family bacteriocin [Oscillospiraceae bacterium]MBM6974026.1 lactococcin 972 family bacteriocin [Lactobacillus gallinarum]MDB6221668.1 lactococcin 972 family bacteriocin [Lactobacillus amylovorus]MDB6225245.1 lactococcin 972 family bacteriocin [Lactobacillus amylovorus]MDB6227219.1 lactococcin 972 family bacteriocin [Lactobacillus amylovorus]